jgi:hypothetical protein
VPARAVRVATDEQPQILRRLLASPQFAHAHSLQRILTFLLERSGTPESPSVKEYEIAVGALSRPPNFDPKTDAVVRVSMAGIRDRLRAYYENEGSLERVRIAVPRGQYRITFEAHEVGPEESAAQSDNALKQFWAPYCTNRVNFLLYNDLLCFRDTNGNYFRNIYLNDRASPPPAAGLAPLLGAEIRPSYHFVSAGEMNAAISLLQTFHRMRAPLQVQNCRFASWAGLQNCNIVVLGSSRTNSFLASLQGEEEFVLTTDAIVHRGAVSNQRGEYRGSRFMSGTLERVTEYALVTRRPGLVGTSSVTLIGANHGRAMEGAVQFLTREDKVWELMNILVPGDHSGPPAHFQVLLLVDLIDFDEEVMDVQYVTHLIP